MRIGIAQKLSIVFFFFIILLTSVISFLAYRTFASQIFKEIESRLTTDVRHTMQIIDRTLFERISDVALLTSKENKILVNDEGNIGSESIKDEIEYLRNVEKIRKVYASMSIYDAKGIKLGDTRGLLIGVDESKKPFFKTAIQGNIYWDNEPVMSKSLGFPVMHFAGSLKDIHGNIKGVLVTRFPVGKLHDILRDTIGDKSLGGVNVDLMDDDGLILFSNHDRANVLKQKFGNFETIQKAINSDKKEVINFTAQENGEKRLFIAAQQQGYLDFKGNNWILVVSVKPNLLFKSVNDLLRTFFLIGLLLVVMLIPFSIFFSRAISRPLLELTRIMDEVGKGDLNKSITIKSNDEIGELAVAFNKMIKNLEHVTASRDELDREIGHRKLMEEELMKSYDDLKQAQTQLFQSEKLASIGQLAAGVAHEINNPVGFISNNMEILQEYVGNYTKILRIVENVKGQVDSGDVRKAKAAVDELKKLEEEINLEFMMGDVNKLLEHSSRGLERIRKIVLDLRTFAREDHADTMELVKIEEVIDSILSIVQSELKSKAELVKDYGDTPLIKCNPQRLGQVFINLLVNATQAIKEKGKIIIKTYQQDQHVCIDISDTGKGILEENLKKIFDPFFTTKPVGQGTGLGLSVSYEIVKKHGGEIKVQSKQGEGTTFTVMLPPNNFGVF